MIADCVQAIYGELRIARPGALCPSGEVALHLNANADAGPWARGARPALEAYRERRALEAYREPRATGASPSTRVT